jgi:hypothetical protein
MNSSFHCLLCSNKKNINIYIHKSNMRDKIWLSCVCYYSDTYLVVMIFLLRPRSNFDEISTQLDIAEILLKEALNTIKQIKNKANLVYIQT